MTSAQRAFLRSQAQTIGSVVMVGRDGLSENVVSALDEALECHELVKVRFQAHKDEIQSISRELEKRSASASMGSRLRKRSLRKSRCPICGRNCVRSTPISLRPCRRSRSYPNGRRNISENQCLGAERL